MLNRVLRDPQTQNSYAYARNNPIKFIDPDGEWIESALDIGFMAFDIVSLKQNIQSGKVGGAVVDSVSLVADTGGLILPGFTGLGLGVRGVAKGTADGVNALTDAAKAASNTIAKGGTYKLIDSSGNVIRTGRTNNLDRRAIEHSRDATTSQYKFEVDRRTDDYAQQRGREQIIHDFFKPVLNKINPISVKNPRREQYLDAAKKLE